MSFVCLFVFVGVGVVDWWFLVGCHCVWICWFVGCVWVCGLNWVGLTGGFGVWVGDRFWVVGFGLVAVLWLFVFWWFLLGCDGCGFGGGWWFCLIAVWF